MRTVGQSRLFDYWESAAPVLYATIDAVKMLRFANTINSQFFLI